jgi:succinate dehydrogenase / fumarate reductase cytochrome b subunit
VSVEFGEVVSGGALNPGPRKKVDFRPGRDGQGEQGSQNKQAVVRRIRFHAGRDPITAGKFHPRARPCKRHDSPGRECALQRIGGRFDMPAQPSAKRPVFLDPLKIRLPVTATASFAHRVSGLLLALALPFLVQTLSLSLRDPAGYARVAGLAGGAARPALLVLAWALAHHGAAGVRHLLFDAGIGTGLATAKKSAWATHGFALAVAALAAGVLW